MCRRQLDCARIKINTTSCRQTEVSIGGLGSTFLPSFLSVNNFSPTGGLSIYLLILWTDDDDDDEVADAVDQAHEVEGGGRPVGLS